MMPLVPENESRQFKEINEIFNDYDLSVSRNDSIYQIEDYVKTLPDMIPEEFRRDIVTKIISASNLDNSGLVGDGTKRLDTLSGYSAKFSKETDTFINSRIDQIDRLEKQITQLREEVNNRHDIHEKQIKAVNAEMSRLKNIISFLSEL